MKKQNALGVRAILRCPRCGHEYETTVSAGTGIRPGQTIDTEHLPGMCMDAYDEDSLADHQLDCPGCPDCERAMDG